MRVLFFASILLISTAAILWAESQPVVSPKSEISLKADAILKLQEKILSELKDIKKELYVIKIRATIHNRVQHA